MHSLRHRCKKIHTKKVMVEYKGSFNTCPSNNKLIFLKNWKDSVFPSQNIVVGGKKNLLWKFQTFL